MDHDAESGHVSQCRREEPLLWTVKELAYRLQIKPSTLYAWAKQGKIPCRKVYGLVRFNPSEIERWLDSFITYPLSSAKTNARRRGSSGVDQVIASAIHAIYTARCEKPDEDRAKQGG